MAALTRAKKANYVLHDKITADTEDREDHTFCGVMFPIKAKNVLPVDHIVVNSLAVRGALGPLTVWVTKEEDHDGQISMTKRHWKKIYSATHAPSYRRYAELDLSSDPIKLRPGQVRGVYVHSTLPGDEAIVYDNKHQAKSHDDEFVTILPGRAHVSNKVFGRTPIWGWGNAWRDNREFVGRISYGAVYRLWNPTENLYFGNHFRTGARNLFLCQRRIESPFSKMPDDVIYYILNMCRWDWMNDDDGDMKVCRRERVRRERLLETERFQREHGGDGGDVLVADGDAGGGGGAAIGAGAPEVGNMAVVYANEEHDDEMDLHNDEMDTNSLFDNASQGFGEDDSTHEDSDDPSDDESIGHAWGDHVRWNDALHYDDDDSDMSDSDSDDDDDSSNGSSADWNPDADVEEASDDDDDSDENDEAAEVVVQQHHEGRRRAWQRARVHIFHMLRSNIHGNNNNDGGGDGGTAQVVADGDDAHIAEVNAEAETEMLH